MNVYIIGTVGHISAAGCPLGADDVQRYPDRLVQCDHADASDHPPPLQQWFLYISCMQCWESLVAATPGVAVKKQ